MGKVSAKGSMALTTVPSFTQRDLRIFLAVKLMTLGIWLSIASRAMKLMKMRHSVSNSFLSANGAYAAMAPGLPDADSMKS